MGANGGSGEKKENDRTAVDGKSIKGHWKRNRHTSSEELEATSAKTIKRTLGGIALGANPLTVGGGRQEGEARGDRPFLDTERRLPPRVTRERMVSVEGGANQGVSSNYRDYVER